MHKRKVELDDLVKEIRKVATENPDFRYRDHHHNCAYVEEVSPGKYEPLCIVGHALVSLGIDPARLDVDFEFEEIYEDFIVNADEIDIDDSEIHWVQTVQINQDTQGVSWLVAVSRADLNKETFWIK